MSQVKHNVVANYIGQFWTSLTGFIFVPLYITLMGIESYGLVGFFGSLAGIFQILDLGLNVTTIREVARLSASSGNERRMRDLIRTLECIYWVVALGIALVVVASSYWIAHHWLRPEHMSSEGIQQSVMLMGVALGFRWPYALYSGGLRGLQRQVLLNWIVGIGATLRGLGVVLVLWLVSPTIQAFLLWQIAVDICQTGICAILLRRRLPRAMGRPRFRPAILREIWLFSAGIAGNSVLYGILTQMDKIVLSKMLTLEAFGYYSLAAVAAAALLKFLAPVEAALFPRFSELISVRDEEKLEKLYHVSCQLVTVLLVSGAVVMALFSEQILLAWTGNSHAVTSSYLVLSILAVGTGIHGTTGLASSLQFAHGWTSLNILQNAISVAVGLPLLVMLTKSHGAEGAAVVWVILSLGAFLITVPIMHTRILKGRQWQWYLYDVGLPAIAAVVVGVLAWYAAPQHLSRTECLVYVGVAFGLACLGSAMAATELRRWILDWRARIPSHR